MSEAGSWLVRQVPFIGGDLGADFGLRHPEALLLGALAALAVARLVRSRPPSVALPSFAEARAAGARRRDPDVALRAALRALAIAALAVVVAGPVMRRAAAPPPELGLDLVLVVDASGSMRALDAELEHEPRTRLDLARRVVSRFARERAESGDRVGLVVFGDSAFTQCPLTRDGALLAASLDRVRPGMAGENTALGDALALAVKRVTARESAADDARAIVLLTDGRGNAGEIPVDLAAELARARGVRVHTVGIGSEGAVAMDQPRGAAGRGLHFARHDLDAETLRFVAEHTGGHAFSALRPADLASVYDAIDALERSERPAPGKRLEAPRPEPWLAAAGGLLAFEIVGLGLLRRTLP